jgi:hypothetical protein
LKNKSQILADFVAEWTELDIAAEGTIPESAWLICCDRAWGIAGAGAIILCSTVVVQ